MRSEGALKKVPKTPPYSFVSLNREISSSDDDVSLDEENTLEGVCGRRVSG